MLKGKSHVWENWHILGVYKKFVNKGENKVWKWKGMNVSIR